MKRIAVAAAAFLSALAFSSCDAVRAEPYPSHPIRLVLPQPAGGAVDLIARALGDRFTEQMRAPVVVENMPGANGSLAAGAVARAAADGYTLMLAVDSNLVINPSLYHNLSYDSFRDFVPISIIARLHMVLVANPKVEANNVRELIAYAKAHPNKLNYASIGLGTAMHMGMELFKFATGTEINQVSYRGTAQAMTDVVAGIVDIMFTGPPSARSMSEGGRLKLLAVASPGRMALIPDVPTMEEAGVPGYEMASWFGLLAPARTPRAIVERLSQEVKTAVDDRKFGERMKAQGLEIVGGTPEAMRSTMQADTEKWAKLIKATGIEIPQ
ncbi:MAG TPA: tripartite tricarboxylate transporter substrate binding protein [Pseudomonadota bacterium]|nr:tripartite tricarboxylate transporter substrate binding protein [Pseudomonadota bacterium]